MREHSRREFLKRTALSILALTVPGRLPRVLHGTRDPDKLVLYIGTYTKGKSEGIYRGQMNLRSGALSLESGVMKSVNPSFLAIDAERCRLFAVNETAEYEGRKTGSVSAFSINPETGVLEFLNCRSSRGGDPCHLTVDRSGRYVLVANYSGGSVAVLPVREDGTLGEATDAVQHTGSSTHPRQRSPHAHSVTLDPANRFAYAADLGIDRVMIYRFDGARGVLRPASPPWCKLPEGAGPRHVAFHPDGGTVFVVNELDSTLARFTVDHSSGSLDRRQRVPTIPGDFTGENYPADVQVAPSGNAVYVSNRGQDTIAVFTIGRGGEIVAVQYQPTGGVWPRSFTIDPTGRYLLVANQRSDTITVFAIEPGAGTLTPIGQGVEVPVPVCLRFL